MDATTSHPHTSEHHQPSHRHTPEHHQPSHRRTPDHHQTSRRILGRWAMVAALLAVSVVATTPTGVAVADSGTLTTSNGSISLHSTQGSTSSSSRTPTTSGWWRRHGWAPWAEDTRSAWYRYDVGHRLSVADLDTALFYPGQQPNSARSALRVDNVGGPPCNGRYWPCGSVDDRLVDDNAGPNRIVGHPSGPQFAMSRRCLGPRAWVVGKRVSDSTDPTRRYQIIEAHRVTADEQCRNNHFRRALHDLSCSADGGAYWASLGFIYNREVFTTALDDQNWVWWNSTIDYSDRYSPYTYRYQEVLVPSDHCPTIGVADAAITVKVGDVAAVDLAAGIDCPQTPTRTSTAAAGVSAGVSRCWLLSERLRDDFATAADGRATISALTTGGALVVRGVAAGAFTVAFVVEHSSGVQATASLRVDVLAAAPTPSDVTVTVAKGRTGRVDLWDNSNCPVGVRCRLDTAALSAEFSRRRAAIAAVEHRDVDDVVCLSDPSGGCDIPAVGDDGVIYVHADRWAGTIKIPFTVVTDAGEVGRATLTVSVVPAPPTPVDVTVTLGVGDVRVVDLWDHSRCPVGYDCALNTRRFRNAFATKSARWACIDGFDAERCGSDAVFADGRVVVRALGVGRFDVPFTIVTDYDDAASATLTVTVVDTVDDVPDVGGAVIVERPAVGRIGGAYTPNPHIVRIVDVTFDRCPTGYRCTPVAPTRSGGASRGYSLLAGTSAVAEATITLAGPYRFCDQPHRCDTPTRSVTTSISTAPTAVDVPFYRATRPGVPYRLSATAAGAFAFVAWRFDDRCDPTGRCRSFRVDRIVADDRSVALAVTITPSPLLTVVGSRLD